MPVTRQARRFLELQNMNNLADKAAQEEENDNQDECEGDLDL